jgi:hypothetical protein
VSDYSFRAVFDRLFAGNVQRKRMRSSSRGGNLGSDTGQLIQIARSQRD